MKLGAQIID